MPKDPSLNFQLLGWVFSADEQSRKIAAAAPHQFLAQLPVDKLPAFELLYRETSKNYYFYNGDPWFTMKPEHLVSFLKFQPHERCGLWCLATFHSSGHVRMRALNLLAGETSGAELPYLILRLNDWVDPIRQLASRLIRERMTPARAKQFIPNLGLILRLLSLSREDHEQFVDSVRAFLNQSVNRAHLLEGLNSQNAQVRKLCHQWLAKASEIDLDETNLRRALADSDMSIRLWAAQMIRHAGQLPSQRVLIDEMSRHSFMPVRREALYYWTEHPGEEADTVYKTALLDPNRSMRESARFYLGKSTPMDFAFYYRDHLSEDCVAAILGLGETGSAADVDLLKPFLKAKKIKAIKAAIKSIAKLNLDACFPDILKLIDGPPGISRTAADVLTAQAAQIDVEYLWSLVCDHQQGYVRLNALKLLDAKDGWTKLPYLIEAAATQKDPIGAFAFERLDAWIKKNNYTQKPSNRGQIDRVRRVLARYGYHFDKAITERLKWILNDFDPQ